MARPKSNGTNASTATIGFEAKLWLAADTATRGSASSQRGAKLRSATERSDNLRNNMDAAETSGASKTAAGSPKGGRGGAHQYSRAERDRSPKAARRVGAEAPINHVVLGLIFLKYISDTAGECRMANAEIRTRNARPLRHSKFVLRHLPPPADARWSHLQASAKQPTIGKIVDDAMVAIEHDLEMSNAEARMWN